jgi:hypothetical protein
MEKHTIRVPTHPGANYLVSCLTSTLTPTCLQAKLVMDCLKLMMRWYKVRGMLVSGLRMMPDTLVFVIKKGADASLTCRSYS